MFPKHHTFRHIHKVSLENHLQNHRASDSGSEGWGFESQDGHPYIKGGKASLAKGRRIPLWKDFDPNPVLDSLCEDAKARADKLPKRELPQPGIPGEEHSPPGIF